MYLKGGRKVQERPVRMLITCAIQGVPDDGDIRFVPNMVGWRVAFRCKCTYNHQSQLPQNTITTIPNRFGKWGECK